MFKILAILVAFFADLTRRLDRVQRNPLFMPTCAVGVLLLAAAVNPGWALAAPLMLGSLVEGQHTGEFIISEANGSRSREEVTVTVPADTTLEAGSVLGKITATGKYVLYDEAAVDGSETAAGILYGGFVNDTAGAVDEAGVIINRDAEVRSDDLQWKAGVDEAGGLVDLLALGIKTRA